MALRGRILRDTNTGPGLLSVNGRQYVFTLEDMWQSELPPRPGMVVDVTFSTIGRPESVRMVADAQLAKEQTAQAPVTERPQSATLSGKVSVRLGVSTLVAEGVLLLSFFLFPCLKIRSGLRERLLTGWDGLGLVTPLTLLNGTGIHKWINVLAIICLFAPLIVPFVEARFARLIYSLPLSFSVLVIALINAGMDNTGRGTKEQFADALGVATAQQMGIPLTDMYTTAFGAWLVFLCSLYLLMRGFIAPTARNTF